MQSMQKGPPSSYMRTDHLGLRGMKQRDSRPSRPESRSHSGRECYRCLGKGHGPSDCKFKEFQCRGCGKAGDPIENICAEHKAVFSSQLGCANGVTAKLRVLPEAKPKFCKARPVLHSEWAAPLVCICSPL
ncbi:hypothetical protein ABG768_020707 [Culter alburnus]|uniref:CCHC-type domain-containing protein n=1 Tax=Culter alburnus TaxID=194366 RepID=A0AAW2B1C3_CULAL